MRRAYVMPFGAEAREGGVRFALWAPHARGVEAELDGGRETFALRARGEGWWEAFVASAGPGTRYMYVLDGALRVPDPASRFAPEGVHGSSEVVDPRAFAWTDEDWNPRPWEEQVLYELHVGAFTQSGTYDGAVERLDDLAALGVTALEIMPLSAAPGERNWGYDGVASFAPNCRYGRPERLKHFIAQAHARGLAVVLDVVYNHFGPEGNYLHAYADPFFTKKHHTPWGEALNYEGCAETRAFLLHNAAYWLEEYGFDGLRLDAVQEIHDDSRPNILEEAAARLFSGEKRKHFFILETNQPSIEHSASCDAQWDDGVHHALHVLVTGEHDGYYAEYAERPAYRLALALTAPPRPAAFVHFLQNHDQVGNRALGDRLGTSALVRLAAAIVLLAPGIPMLFMGEEWAASSPFLYFCDFEPLFAAGVREGRRREFAHFSAFSDEQARMRIPDPGDAETFARSVLRWDERERTPHRETLALYRELLAVRARELAPYLTPAPQEGGRIIATEERALSVSWLLSEGNELSLRANFGDAPCKLPIRSDGKTLFAIGEHDVDKDHAAPLSLLWRMSRA